MTHCVSIWRTAEGDHYAEEVLVEPESTASSLAEKRWRWQRGLDTWSPEEEVLYQAGFTERNRITSYISSYPELTRIDSHWFKPNGDRFMFLTYPEHDEHEHDHEHGHE